MKFDEVKNRVDLYFPRIVVCVDRVSDLIEEAVRMMKRMIFQ